MFGLGRKNDGFEWHKYVRTTIKLRRADRHARIVGARDAAIGGVKNAGNKSWKGLGQLMKTAGSTLTSLPVLIGRRLDTFSGSVRRVLGQIGRRIEPHLAPVARPGVPAALALVGAVCLAAALSRYRVHGFDSTVLVATIAGAIGMVLATSPFLSGRRRVPLPPVISKPLARVRGMVPAAAPGLLITGLLVLGLGWAGWSMITRGMPSIGASVASLPFIGGKVIEGRATAVSGDTLRVGSSLVKLTSIEAPDRAQRCPGPASKRWKCGEAAQEALSKAVRGRQVRCEGAGSPDANGRVEATCKVDGADIAGQLVRDGAVFSASSLIGGYSSQERDARARKVGLWRVDAVERPSEWKSKLWETAKKAAPDGCPIKGQVSSGKKTYLAPWTPDYESARVRTSRGERWFCSESEAIAAGWREAQGG